MRRKSGGEMLVFLVALGCVDIGMGKEPADADVDPCQYEPYAHISVLVRVENEAGSIDLSPDVTYVRDGGAVTEAACSDIVEIDLEEGIFICGLWVIGADHPGQFEIHVEADGYDPADMVVDVPALPPGECHVETQEANFVLELAGPA